METCSEKRQKTSNAFLSGFHALLRNPPTRIFRDGLQDFKATPASEDSGNQGMAYTGQQASPAQRLVASPESQTHRTLQLFWHQWQHPLSEAILLPSEKRGVQWMNRRSQRISMTQGKFQQYLEWHPLPTPRIYHALYTLAPKRGMPH